MWACLLARDGRTGPLGGDSIRLLILIDCLGRHSSGRDFDRATAAALHAVIKRLDETSHDALTVSVANLAERPSQPSARSAKESAISAIGAAASARARTALLRLLDAVIDHLVEGRRKASEAGDRPSRLIFSSGASGHGTLTALNSNSAPETFGVSPISEAPLVRSARDEELVRSGWIAATSLPVNGNGPKALAPIESRGAAGQLVAWLKDHSSNRIQRASVLVVLLVLLTSRGARDIVKALNAMSAGRDSTVFERAENGSICVIREVPGSEKHFHPKGIRLADAVASRFLLPIPTVTSQAIDDSLATTRSLTWHSLSEEIKAVEKALREETPRYFETRARFTIPSLLFGRTGDPAVAQIMSGQDIEMSDAPLAYYSDDAHALYEHWREAVLEASGLQCPEFDASGLPGRIGAPITAIENDEFSSVVARYLDQLRSAETANIEVTHDLLTTYAAHLFAATVGHRGHDTIGTFTWNDIDPVNGICAFSDKPAGPSDNARRCAVLGSIFLKQAAVLLLLRSHIAKSPGVGPQMRTRARRALASDAHIFSIIGEAKERSVSAKDIARFSHPLPANVFRSRLRMHLTTAGVHPRLIYSQLGHVWNGCPPFGREAVESIHDARRTLAAPIDDGLSSDGWSPVIPSCLPHEFRRRLNADSLSIPRQHWPAQELPDVLACKDGNPAASGKRGEHKQANLSPGVTHELRSWIEATLQHWDNGDGTHVRLEQMQSAIVDMAEVFADIPGAVQSGLRQFQAAVLWRQLKHAWTGVVPPLAFRHAPPRTEVDTRHVQAGLLASRIRSATLAECTREGVNARWGRAAVLLLLDRHAADTQALFVALETISGQQVHRGESEQELIGFLPFERRRGLNGTHRLSRELSYLVAFLAGQPVPAKRELARIVRFMIKDLLPAEIETPWSWLASLARLASRVEVAGVQWTQSDLCDPTTLSIPRTREWIENRAGIESRGSNQSINAFDPGFRNRNTQYRAALGERRSQYKELRSALNTLREPAASKRRLRAGRYARARELLRHTARDPSSDELVVLLALFALDCLESEKRPRVGTVYNRMTSIGLRLINSLGSRNLTDLEEKELTQLFIDVLKNTPIERRAEVAAQLYAFHRCHAMRLDPVDTYALRALAGQHWPGIPDTGTINNAEFALLIQSVDRAASEGRMSRFDADDLKACCTLMFQDGLRIGEVTHAPIKHLGGGGRYLAVRSSPLGTIKTRNADRIVGEAIDWGAWSSTQRSGNEPLFFHNNEWSLPAILKEIQRAGSSLSGGEARGLHDFRHSSISYGLLSVDPAGKRDPWLVASEIATGKGHSRPRTAVETYWHFQHLAWQLIPSEQLDSAQLSRLTGLKRGTIRKRRAQRGQILLLPDLAPLPAAVDLKVPDLFPEATPEGNQVNALRLIVDCHAGKSIAEAAEGIALDPETLQATLVGIRDLMVQFRLAAIPPDVLTEISQYRIDRKAERRIHKIRLNRQDSKQLQNGVALRCSDPSSVFTAIRRPKTDWTRSEANAISSTAILRGGTWLSPSIRAKAVIAAAIWAIGSSRSRSATSQSG